MAISATYELCVDWDNDGSYSGIDDITADVLFGQNYAINWTRGRDKQLGMGQAATLEFVAKNRDGKYSPENGSSPLHDKLLPGRPVRLRATYSGVIRDLFHGFISRITPYPWYDKENCYFYCVDGMKWLDMAKVSMANIPDRVELSSTTSDGEVGLDGQANYITGHDAAAGNYINKTQSIIQIRNSNYLPLYCIGRGFLFFDTSSIPADADIISAVVRMTLSDKVEEDAGHATQHIVEGVQDDPLALNDYGDHLAKTTSGGSITYANLPASGNPFDIILNSTGRGWINPGSMTKLCIRVSGDINKSTPTGWNEIDVDSANNGNGTGPKLILEYL